MRNITRTVYVTKESLDLIDKDINAVEKYTLFSNREQGTIEVDISIKIPEEFKITEDILLDIISGLTPALSEKEHEQKLNQVILHLRSIGAAI
jgi:hypothetical protein